MELEFLPDIQRFESVIDRYEQCFHSRDLTAFRALHATDGKLVFFDNHAGCDSASYLDHEAKIAAFFQAGAIVGLLRERLRVFATDQMPCITTVHRYVNRPVPGVRTTYVLELEGGEWRIRHMHHSFDPNESTDEKDGL